MITDVAEGLFCARSGKICYPARPEAEKARRNVGRRSPVAMNVYFCGVCGGFHIGRRREIGKQ